jgi:hypothetical protein
VPLQQQAQPHKQHEYFPCAGSRGLHGYEVVKGAVSILLAGDAHCCCMYTEICTTKFPLSCFHRAIWLLLTCAVYPAGKFMKNPANLHKEAPAVALPALQGPLPNVRARRAAVRPSACCCTPASTAVW